MASKSPTLAVKTKLSRKPVLVRYILDGYYISDEGVSFIVEDRTSDSLKIGRAI